MNANPRQRALSEFEAGLTNRWQRTPKFLTYCGLPFRRRMGTEGVWDYWPGGVRDPEERKGRDGQMPS
jgi:hypothetical protein